MKKMTPHPKKSAFFHKILLYTDYRQLSFHFVTGCTWEGGPFGVRAHVKDKRQTPMPSTTIGSFKNLHVSHTYNANNNCQRKKGCLHQSTFLALNLCISTHKSKQKILHKLGKIFSHQISDIALLKL